MQSSASITALNLGAIAQEHLCPGMMAKYHLLVRHNPETTCLTNHGSVEVTHLKETWSSGDAFTAFSTLSS